MIDIHRKAFIEEAIELLAELESSLLELEKDPDNKELIAKVFRALHTIKGSSGMFGYDDISMFTHDIENVYDHIRNGELRITKDIIDLTLAARDQISFMLIQTDGIKTVDEDATRQILTSFRGLVNQFNSRVADKKADNVIETKKQPQIPERAKKAFFVSFKPTNDIFSSGTNPVLLINELHELGKAIIVSYLNMVPAINELNPEFCYTYWHAVLITNKSIDAIKDIFIFIEDQCELRITELVDNPLLLTDEGFNLFESQVNEDFTNDRFDLESCLKDYRTDTSTEIIDTPKKFKHKIKDESDASREHDTSSSIRVSAEKLDELVNLVGELVTTQARLNQIALSNQDVNIVSVAEEVERITWSLRDSALNIRMLPIGTTFSKFNRLLRDLTKELGKEVVLTTEGEETELD
jgi:two-component system chemotaxis sensor kinase CheA